METSEDVDCQDQQSPPVCDTTSKTSSKPPDGGIVAWTQVFGCFWIWFNTWCDSQHPFCRRFRTDNASKGPDQHLWRFSNLLSTLVLKQRARHNRPDWLYSTFRHYIRQLLGRTSMGCRILQDACSRWDDCNVLCVFHDEYLPAILASHAGTGYTSWLWILHELRRRRCRHPAILHLEESIGEWRGSSWQRSW